MMREVIIPELVEEDDPQSLASSDAVAIEVARTRRVEMVTDTVKTLALLGALVLACQAVCT